MWQKAVLDRIVDGLHAVLLVGEEEWEHVLPASQLPLEAKEGTWLRVRFVDGNLVEVQIDLEETGRARERLLEKLNRLRERGRRL